MKDLYKTLGIPNTSPPEDIKSAYYRLAKQYHPDASDKNEIKMFYEITEAYQILSDTEERRAYDLAMGGGKIAKILVEETPAHPNIYKEEKKTDEEFRRKEMGRFRKKIFWLGVVRVIGSSLFGALIGYLVSFVLEGIALVSAVAAFAVALVWSVNSNFDVNSFVTSPKRKTVLKIIGWVMFLAGVGYFVVLAVNLLM
jgi:hypothetical protein